jgi:hypothetical protein
MGLGLCVRRSLPAVLRRIELTQSRGGGEGLHLPDGNLVEPLEPFALRLLVQKRQQVTGVCVQSVVSPFHLDGNELVLAPKFFFEVGCQACQHGSLYPAGQFEARG